MSKKTELKAVPLKDFQEKVLKQEVEQDNPLKKWLINYVGEKNNPDDGIVTVEMVIDTFHQEFPQALLAVAEANWIRGYEQAAADYAQPEFELDKMFKEGYNKAVIDMGLEQQRRYAEMVDRKKSNKNEKSSRKITSKKKTK